MEQRANTKTSVGLVAAAAVMMASAVAACGQPSPSSERTCSGEQAVSVSSLRGTSLPAKTLALTFDDGPGARTLELSTFLKNQGIRAGFFVNGKMVSDVAVLAQLVADGHVIGNHTQNHLSLTGRSTGVARLADALAVTEISQTDAIIAPYVTADRLMFRAPFGDYDDAAAGAINASTMQKYVGTIGWDIGDHMGPNQAVDWDCWQPGPDGLVLTVAQCGSLYLQEIDAVGRGIILFHDPYFADQAGAKDGTVDMVEAMVPVLKAKGYTFARVDEVPDIAALLPALPPPPDAGLPLGDGGAESGGGSGGDSGAPKRSHGGGQSSSGSTTTNAEATTGTTAAAPSGSASGGKPDPCSASPQQKSGK